MDPLFSPADFRKYFYACVILAVICLAGAILAIASSAYGNVIEQTVVGTGTMDTRHDSVNAADHAMAQDAAVVYEMTRKWGPGEDGQKFSTSFIVSGAGGGYKNQYVVKGSGAAHKVEYRATQISGDFSGQGDVIVSATPGGGENLDSTINLDSRNGNATFQGRVWNSVKGRPATIEELDAVGQLLIKSYLNISDVPETPEDWLGFCDRMNRDMILDESVPTGIYIAPDGFTVDENGVLRPDPARARGAGGGGDGRH